MNKQYIEELNTYTFLPEDDESTDIHDKIANRVSAIHKITDKIALADIKSQYEAVLKDVEARIASANRPVNPESITAFRKLEAEAIMQACDEQLQK